MAINLASTWQKLVFIADGRIAIPAEHHLLAHAWVRRYCAMMELPRRWSRQIERLDLWLCKGLKV